MRAPDFWGSGEGGVLPLLLSPISSIYAAATARRLRRPGWRASVPVLCCGNATAGGAGKTTVALEIGRRLAASGTNVFFLLRGYGGSERGPLLVDPAKHDSQTVGDEALLLAAERPTVIAADRAAGARAAIAAGAEAIVMDDGLQNPTLEKDLSLLVVDGNTGFGNGRVIPSGPLREPVANAASRVRAAVVIGEDVAGVAQQLPPALPVLRARLVPGEEASLLRGQPVFAFCGIASPRKFFATLTEAGTMIAGRMAYADHYPYDPGDMRDILARADALRAIPVTTRKDFVRIPAAFRSRVTVVAVRLQWEDEAAVDGLLGTLRLRLPEPA